MRFLRPPSPRYYVYLSKTKLDMLYPQVTSEVREKKATEWKLDLKLMNVSRKTERVRVLSQDARLEAVIETLEKARLVGTVGDPKAYIKGTLSMRWGFYEDHGRPEAEPPLVYFGAITEKTVLGLGGSSRHAVAFPGATNTGSRSATPSLVSHLLKQLGIPKKGWHCDGPAMDTDYQICEAVAAATTHLQGPQITMEFFAKTSFRGVLPRSAYLDARNMNILLGTPLYVADVHPTPRRVSDP